MRTSAIIAEELTGSGYKVLTGKAVCQGGKQAVSAWGMIYWRHYREEKPRRRSNGKWMAEMKTECLEYIDYLNGEMAEAIPGCRDSGLRRGPVVASDLICGCPSDGVEDTSRNTYRPAREGFASANHGMMHACGHDCHAAIGLGTARILASVRGQLHGK